MTEETIRVFVDAIEDDEATLVVGDKRFAVPRAILPTKAGEGTWLRIAVEGDDGLASEIESRRERLRATDPGGDIKL